MTDRTVGRRIYVVADIHGRLDLLTEMVARIDRDIAARPHGDVSMVFLGDYVDRGPDSRGVIDKLIELKASERDVTFLLGNHDSYVAAYIEDPIWFDRPLHWLNPRMGGDATLASYGVLDATEADPAATHEAFKAALPPEHLAFLQDCELIHPVGGYIFVHAGIRPGVALGQQRRDDLIWIREPFLSSTKDFGGKVVHGHTIVPEVQHRPNRIALDTGAYHTEVLSCLVLEGDDVSLLTPEGPAPCPVGSGYDQPGLKGAMTSRFRSLLKHRAG